MSVGWSFTDRRGGSSGAPYDEANLGLHVGDDPAAVAENRASLLGTLGVDALATMSQVHGATVLRVDRGGEAGEADAIITSRPRIALVVLVADCVPVLLFDERASLVGAVHAGWRGAAADVIAIAVERMVGLGATSGSLRAVIGPAICGDCYEVGPEVVEQVGAVMPAAPGVTSWGADSVDLRAGMVERLARLGVGAEIVGGCTFEHPDLYFSYRRDGITGRQAGAIWLT